MLSYQSVQQNIVEDDAAKDLTLPLGQFPSTGATLRSGQVPPSGPLRGAETERAQRPLSVPGVQR